MATRKSKRHATPRAVDPINNKEDKACLEMAIRGRSNRAIHTVAPGLTDGQISYRCQKYEVRRTDYRDGVSDFARAVDKVSGKLAQQQLLRILKHHGGANAE